MTEADGAREPRYRVRPVTTPAEPAPRAPERGRTASDPFLRPANEDDDGYDPFSDRPPAPEPSFEPDPWR